MKYELFNHQNKETEENEEGGNMTMKEALNEVGLSGIAEAPRPRTVAYKRLMDAAAAYMAEVKKVEKVAPQNNFNQNESDDYYRPIVINKNSSSDSIRRSHHDTLAKMLLGKPRKGLSKQEADQLSNFAAYMTGDEEYIDRW